MAANTIRKYQGTYLSQPYDEHQTWERSLATFKTKTVGGVQIERFPEHLDMMVTHYNGRENLIAPLTIPLRAALILVGEAYHWYDQVQKIPDHKQGKTDLVHAFIRSEELWGKVEDGLNLYARDCWGADGTAAQTVVAIEDEFRFVNDFEDFFHLAFGRQTLNFQVFCPLLDQLAEFNQTTALLMKDVEEWAGDEVGDLLDLGDFDEWDPLI